MFATLLRRPARLLAPVLGAVSFAAAAIAAPPDIAGLAPSRSFLVVGVPDFKALTESFKATELGKLWEEPAVKTFIESITEDASKGFSDLLKEINAEADDLHPPQGQVGLAMFFPEKPANPAAEGADEPDATPFFLAVADMGAHAGEWDALLEKLLDKGVQDKKIRVEHDTYQGTPVTIVHPVIDEEAATKERERRERFARGEYRPEDFKEEAGDSGFELGWWIGGSLDERRTVRLARVESLFAVSTEQRAFEDAIDALKGKAIEAVGENADFRLAQDQNPAGSLAWTVVMVDRLLARAAGAGDADDPMSMMMDAVGIRGLKAVSGGLRFGTAEGMVDVSMGILVPEKTGLLELLSTPAGGFDPPGFVPADVAGYSRINFDFPKVFQVVRRMIARLPEENRAEAAPQVELIRDMINPALTAMGPAVHIVSAIDQPLSAESSRTTFVIEVRDQEAVSNTLSAVAMKVQGMLEPGDFEGNQTYSIDTGFFQLQIGLGFNHLFIGTETAVRSAMRLAGRPEGAALSGEPAFKEATAALAPGAVMYSWADIEQDLRWQYWSTKNQAEIMEQQLAKMGIEPEERAEWIKNMKEEQGWTEKLPPLETILPHLGDIASELRPTPDGFRGRALMLRPREKK
ncbi:MAG: hypothetical protein WD749_10505 [Phycisphaerales bacterium]